MFQGTLMQKIRFLGQKLWPVAREQKDTGHRTYIVKNRDHFSRRRKFLPSAYVQGAV